MGIEAGTAESFGPVGGEALVLVGLEAVAEGVGSDQRGGMVVWARAFPHRPNSGRCGVSGECNGTTAISNQRSAPG